MFIIANELNKIAEHMLIFSYSVYGRSNLLTKNWCPQTGTVDVRNQELGSPQISTTHKLTHIYAMGNEKIPIVNFEVMCINH